MKFKRLYIKARRFIRYHFEPMDRDGVVLWGCVFFTAFAATYGV